MQYQISGMGFEMAKQNARLYKNISKIIYIHIISLLQWLSRGITEYFYCLQ